MAQITEAFALALQVMAMGMLLVFLFLSLLIAGIKIVATRYAPGISSVPVQSSDMPHTKIDKKKLAAITAAIHLYRTKN
ncbi:OadG family transporter subunit [Shewanella sp. NFH-SH190041]|uniref:OadG family transporter subunit n=1 Tax=Shewanella sp. NFH-SH190041 TaxID=2950245 RepID=UPI0021C46FED|nr:OadG family transporter subunit [Shewanella sp. NFH-SH190041]